MRQFKMEVVLPTTHVGVVELLHEMIKTLNKDADRYMKSNKVPITDPAVQDKLDAADAMSRIIQILVINNRNRWKGK